jgi:hypothetical protein
MDRAGWVNATLVACLAAAVGVGAMVARTGGAAREERFGVCSEREIVRRTQPLLTTLSPEGGPWRLELMRGRAADRLWSVRAMSERAYQEVHAAWNADTGELFSLSWIRPKPRRTADSVPGRGQAAAVGFGWLRALGVASYAPRWQLDGEPRRFGSVWETRWRAAGRLALVRLDARNGDLVAAQSRRVRA